MNLQSCNIGGDHDHDHDDDDDDKDDFISSTVKQYLPICGLERERDR